VVLLEQARANRTTIDWSSYQPPRPRLLLQQYRDAHDVMGVRGSGDPRQHVRVFHGYPLEEVRDYIDWQPFFNAWEIKGHFPDVLDHPTAGEAARRLWEDAQRMLDALVEERWLRASGVVGLFPANAVGDDIEVYHDETRDEVAATLHHLRQQGAHRPGIPNRSLADYVAPRESGLRDYVGVFAEGQAMLDRVVRGRWLTASGVYGLWPANAVGDDVEIYTDDARSGILGTWHNLRQQNQKPTGNPNLCLSDFVAPRDNGPVDYIGAFAVTAGLGIEAKLEEYRAQNDDYGAIMLKAIADRLAEAFAEHLHQRVRTEFWGYASGESLSNAELVGEKYRGIRPAPGYPACPDHTEKGELFRLLDATRNADIQLTDTFAMQPAAAVSGFYLAHPQARYFAVGKIERDQVGDYAHRKGMDLAHAERWLAPVLNY